LLHTDRGRALAKMRRITETLRAIGTADDHFAHFTPDNEPPCMARYNDAGHALVTGRSLADLAILGRDPGEATNRLTAAAAGAGHTRAQAIRLTMLASLTMATSDPIQAATIGHAALDAADTLRSRRVTEELRELARYTATHQHLDEVAIYGSGSPLWCVPTARKEGVRCFPPRHAGHTSDHVVSRGCPEPGELRNGGGPAPAPS
jgi:hypothetical protein